MKVFELHFNPKAKEDRFFDTFLFEPENIFERKLGNLYLTGELEHILPQNLQFLERVSSHIKKEYYRVSERSPEAALKESLRKTNEFLAGEVERGNVQWLGNFHFAALSLKDSFFNFTKAGGFKVFLLRGGQIFDIGKNLEFEEIQPYPLKIFGNIVSGKLALRDKILVLSKNISDIFSQQNIIADLAKLPEIDEKKIKAIFQKKENLIKEISGVCLLIDITEDFREMEPKTKKEKITIEKILPRFPRLKIPALKIPALPRFSLPRMNFLLRFPTFPKKQKIKISENFKKRAILILSLLLLLIVGNFIFNIERETEIKETQTLLKEFESEITVAEKAFLTKNTKEANSLYQKILQELLPYTREGEFFQEEFLKLKKDVEEKLLIINKFQGIPEPELLFDFEEKKFIPQKMIFANGNLYLFSPTESRISRLSIPQKTNDFIGITQKPSFAAFFGFEKILFYAKPDILIPFQNGGFGNEIFLRVPYSDFQFNSFSPYKSNLYFLDSKKGEIIRYTLEEQKREIPGSLWLNPITKKVIESKSFAVDGSIWVLNEDNLIDRFEGGVWQGALNLDFYPPPKNLTKIFTSPAHSYLYLLEPAQKRIVIVSKFGQIVKQLQSGKFENLKDFAVSENGRIIYLLNGLKVYKISL